jgi:hypothetical protein
VRSLLVEVILWKSWVGAEQLFEGLWQLQGNLLYLVSEGAMQMEGGMVVNLSKGVTLTGLYYLAQEEMVLRLWYLLGLAMQRLSRQAAGPSKMVRELVRAAVAFEQNSQTSLL